MKLSIGIVNFNAGHRLRQCIEAIAKHPPSVPYEVVVVDNDSTDGSADFLASGAFRQVRYVRLPYNLGYTGGFNRAFQESTGEYFFVYNNDIVAQPGSLDAIVRHMDEDPTLGAIGGWQTTVDGRFEKYVNRFPRVRDAYLAAFLPREKAERDAGFRRYHMLDADFSKPVEAPQPAGGCLLVRRALFPEGLMSPVFGIFWSDVEMARKVYARGHRIMMFPDAPFVHDHPWDRKPKPTDWLLDLDYYVGCARYFRLYEGRAASWRIKLLFGLRLLARLVAIEVPARLRGRKPRGHVATRARVLWRFLTDRNTLLEDNLKKARSAA